MRADRNGRVALLSAQPREARPPVRVYGAGMFSVERRTELLRSLIEAAQSDEEITGAALVGSMARQDADRWSDIDLALRLAVDAHRDRVIDRWSTLMQELGPVADHLDIASGDALYRVFLLADSLQVDLSFWPSDSFASGGEPFEVLFGDASPTSKPAAVDSGRLVGWAWLYALHARSALERGRTWQALQMVAGLRDQLIALACLRHGLPPFEGRGADRLPREELAAIQVTVASTPDDLPLRNALGAALDLLQRETSRIDGALARNLAPALVELRVTRPGSG